MDIKQEQQPAAVPPGELSSTKKFPPGLGFSTQFLAKRTDEETQLLVNCATSIQKKTREETGLSPSRNIPSMIEHAVGSLRLDARFLANKTEEEVQLLIASASSKKSSGDKPSNGGKVASEGKTMKVVQTGPTPDQAVGERPSICNPTNVGIRQALSSDAKNSENSARSIADAAPRPSPPSKNIKKANAIVLTRQKNPPRGPKLNKSHQANWDRNIEALRQYKAVHGHTNVPHREGKLGQFVQHQRQNYRKGSRLMTEERIRDLEGLGFMWSLTQQKPKEVAAITKPTQAASKQHSMEPPRPKNNGNVDRLVKPVSPSGHSSSTGAVQCAERALNIGIAAPTIPKKSEEEAKVLIHTDTTISKRTKQNTGSNNATDKPASSVEHALAVEYTNGDCSSKTEDEVLQLESSQNEMPEVEKELLSKATNVTLSDEEEQLSSGEDNSSEEEEEENKEDDDNDEGSVSEGEEDSEIGNQTSSGEQTSSDEEGIQSSSEGESESDDDENSGESESQLEELDNGGQSSSSDEHNSIEGEDQHPTSEEESENSDDERVIEEESESEVEELEVDDHASSDDHSSRGEEESDIDDLSSVEESDADDGEMASDKRSDSDCDSDGDSDSEREKSEDDEDLSDDDDASIASDSSEDVSDVSVYRPLGRRGSLLKPSSSFNNGANQRREIRTNTASRFKMWMGRKKSSTPIESMPKRKKPPMRNQLNEERWEKNIAALKAYKAKYGDFYVPSNYGSLGRFVRNTRALNNDPDHAKSQTLTEDRRQMLEEIDFQWVLPFDLRSSNAHRKRSRRILRAASTIHKMKKYGGATSQIYANASDSDQKDIAKHVAQHVINTEVIKSVEEDPGVFRLGLLAGVTEVDLYEAFTQLDQGGDIDIRGDKRSSPHLSTLTSESSLQEWLIDRKVKWRQQRKRKLSEVNQPKLPEEVERVQKVEDKGSNGPILLYSRFQTEKGFEMWLADRKIKWKQHQQEKWEHKRIMDAEHISLSTHIQSDKKFQCWLSARKVMWTHQISRKRRKTEHMAGNDELAQDALIQTRPTAAINADLSRSEPFDYKNVGVRHMPSGNWEVGIVYQGRRRIIGTFDTQNNAAKANEIARKMLKKTNKQLTAEEVQQNVQLARNAADQEVGLSARKGKAAPRLNPAKKKKKTQPDSSLDFENVGVRQTSSGRWSVEISFRSKLRYMGTFDTNEQAALVNKISRQIFDDGKDIDLTDKEIDGKVLKAREASSNALALLKQNSVRTNQVKNATCKARENRTVICGEPGMKNIAQTAANAPKEINVTKNSTQTRKFPSGLRHRSNGSWEVSPSYWGKQRYIGIFPNIEQATLAMHVARRMLKTGNGPKPPKEEIEKSVKLAREAAFNAVRKNPGDGGTKLKSTIKRKLDHEIVKPGKKCKASAEKNRAAVTLSSEKCQITPIDYKSVGVRQTPSLKWEVNHCYHGQRLRIGALETQNQAAVANETLRKMLKTEKGSKPSPEIIESHIKLARKMACDAVKAMLPEKTPPNDEDRLNKMLKSVIAGSKVATVQPKLSSSPVQPERGFQEWLKDRKSKWVVHRQRTVPPKAQNAPARASSTVNHNEKLEAVHGTRPPTAESKQSGKLLPEAPLDYRNVGVRQTSSGKWEVAFRYQGLRRNIGTFETQNHAALANEIARKRLNADKGLSVAADKVEENMKLAREAAWDAVLKSDHPEDDVPPNAEDTLKIWLLSDEIQCKESGGRPKLLSTPSQTDIAFSLWLLDKKNKWGQCRQKEGANTKRRLAPLKTAPSTELIPRAKISNTIMQRRALPFTGSNAKPHIKIQPKIPLPAKG